MYGAVRATLRSVGFLNACRCWSIRRTLNRPESGSIVARRDTLRDGTPITSGSFSIIAGGIAPLNVGAKWQVPHLAPPLNKVEPSRASARLAPASPRTAPADRPVVGVSEPAVCA